MRGTKRPSKRKTKLRKSVSRKKCKTCSRNKTILMHRKLKTSRGLRGGARLGEYKTYLDTRFKFKEIVQQQPKVEQLKALIYLLLQHYNAKDDNEKNSYYPGLCKVLQICQSFLRPVMTAKQFMLILHQHYFFYNAVVADSKLSDIRTDIVNLTDELKNSFEHLKLQSQSEKHTNQYKYVRVLCLLKKMIQNMDELSVTSDVKRPAFLDDLLEFGVDVQILEYLEVDGENDDEKTFIKISQKQKETFTDIVDFINGLQF